MSSLNGYSLIFLDVIYPLLPWSSVRSTSGDVYMQKNVWVPVWLHSEVYDQNMSIVVTEAAILCQFIAKVFVTSTFIFRSLSVTPQILLSTDGLKHLRYSLSYCCFSVQVSALHNTVD